MNKPLQVTVANGVLRIEIGINTLAHAVTYSDWANPWDDDKDDYFRTFAITDAEVFARDVKRAMEDEAEDGSTPLNRFLDTVTEEAVNQGSEACEFDQHIAFNKTAPGETWAGEPGAK